MCNTINLEIKQKCNKCGVEKDLEEFNKQKSRKKNGRQPTCRICANIKNRIWKEKNKDKSLYVALRYKYGTTLEELESILKDQNYLCGICGVELNHKFGKKESKSPQPDHVKGTHEIRGILCYNCNTSIGKFKHDPDILYKAIEWITKSPTLIGNKEKIPFLNRIAYGNIKYKGVSLSKSGKKFRAQINIKVNLKYKNIGLGDFDYPEQAALAYNCAALKYLGSDTYLNQVDPNWKPKPLNLAF